MNLATSMGRTRALARIAVAAVVLVTACSPQPDTGPTDALPDSCPLAPGHPIRLAAGADLSSSGVRGRLVAQWNTRCPRRPARLIELPANADLQRSQMAAAEQAEDATYDVLALDVTWTAEFAAGGLILPLSEKREKDLLDEKDFLEAPLKTVTIDGKVWGVPFNTDAGLLYYRKDILEAVGARPIPPNTREELAKAIGAIAASDYAARHKEYQAGYITQLKSYEGLTVNAMEAIWSREEDRVDDDGKVVHDPVGAAEGLKNLVTEYRDLMPASALTADETTSQQAFASGAVAFMRNWPYAYDVLAKKLVPGVDFDVTTLPGSISVLGGSQDATYKPGVSVLGGQNLAVSARSTQADAAYALITFLTSKVSERCLIEGGFAATRESAYEPGPTAPRCTAPQAGSTAPATTPPGPDAEQAGPMAPAGKLPGYAGKLREALESARPRPVTPYYAAFTGLVQSKVGALLSAPPGGGPAARDLIDELGPVLKGQG